MLMVRLFLGGLLGLTRQMEDPKDEEIGVTLPWAPFFFLKICGVG